MRATKVLFRSAPLSVEWQRRIDQSVQQFAKLNQTPISVKQFVLFGKEANLRTVARSHAFLRNELPIRLAHLTKVPFLVLVYPLSSPLPSHHNNNVHQQVGDP